LHQSLLKLGLDFDDTLPRGSFVASQFFELGLGVYEGRRSRWNDDRFIPGGR
jgi:hypothetical protein